MKQMTVVGVLTKTRLEWFQGRSRAGIGGKIALALALAAITGLTAQIRIPLPWTPVPMTGQTFAVLLAGILLGGFWGGLSQALYVILGLAGIPWFAGGIAGPAVLSGPSGGYIIGFIFAAAFLGHVSDKYVRARRFLPLLGLMLFADLVLIHLPGLLQLELWFYMIKGTIPSLTALVLTGSAPFVLGDGLKIIAAAALARAMTPQEPFTDRQK